ncbi:cuticle protein 14-like [Stegodyphus dumicola]|uniref:cuticle protein 14-like n=1 Tax=Stegodyphus dumicola TaxID=202533 RepID=UPI0015B1704D|nr:cuticle protein 14-like [Stegodyphus dumicola]
MKAFILCTLFAASQAAVLFSAPALLSTGASTQYRAQDSIGNYNFGYDEGHLSGGTFRKESGDVFGNKIGSYGLRDADGRQRIVNYVADAAGFRADIKTNEPGVEPKDPAATTINKALISAPAPVLATYAAAPAITYAAATPALTYAAHPLSYAAAPLAHYGYYNKAALFSPFLH